MYCDYFGFVRRPFEMTPDPTFLYLGEAHREGLATLVAAGDAEQVLAEAEDFGVPAKDLGAVGGDRLKVQCAGEAFDSEVETLYRAWSTALPKALAE